MATVRCPILPNLRLIRSFVICCKCVSEGGFGSLVSQPCTPYIGCLRLTALVFMSGGVASVDSGTADALVAMQSNFDVDSTVMTRRLVEVRKNYFIPLEYELHEPLLGSVPMTPFRMASVC
ncbi:hypothetical protein GW17_00042826 [Ensete ventricosum]|nr:hypothetical protein GW17_00042826 [Ensete ventricosum]